MSSDLLPRSFEDKERSFSSIQPMMAVVAKIAPARAALPSMVAKLRAFARSMPLVKSRHAAS